MDNPHESTHDAGLKAWRESAGLEARRKLYDLRLEYKFLLMKLRLEIAAEREEVWCHTFSEE